MKPLETSCDAVSSRKPTETFLKCPFFVGFLVSFCWLSFCRKMEVHDPKELLEVIIANESARDLLQSFISETVRPEVSA